MWAPLLALPRQHNAVSPAQWCLKLSTQTQHGTNISAWTYEWKSQSCLLMALKFTFHCTNYQQVPRGKNHWCVRSTELWTAHWHFAMCTSGEFPGVAIGLLGWLQAGQKAAFTHEEPEAGQRVTFAPRQSSTCLVMPWMLWRASLIYEATSTEQ